MTYDLNSLFPFLFVASGFIDGVCFTILWQNKNNLKKSGTSRVKDV